MRRRNLLLAAGVVLAPKMELSIVAAWTLAASAQQKAKPVIGYLSGGSADYYAPNVSAFREGLGETGYIEGGSVGIEYRWAENDYGRLPALAADLVSRNVDLIAATGGDAGARAAKAATSTIPIVFNSGADPVSDGLVASLAHPGGNLTGTSFLVAEMHAKRLELLLELVPQAKFCGLLVNPDDPQTDRVKEDVRQAGRTKQIELLIAEARSEGEIDEAFARFSQHKVGGLVVMADPFIDSRREQLVGLAARYAIPAVYGFREIAKAGGLISYGASITAVYHQLGIYAGTILKGTRPGDLPVQQPTKFELVINLKTAKSLGLTVPPSLLARADEVIE